MADLKDFLPPIVFEIIRNHLRELGNSAHVDWEAGEADEDTLTGYLGKHLERPWVDVRIPPDTKWRWRVTHKKFRGRGKGAFEKLYGADGIFQVETFDGSSEPQATKGVLYQAKKNDYRADRNLKDQLDKMEKLAPGSSAVIGYDAEGYVGVGSVSYLRENARRLIFSRGDQLRLGNFLADKFMPCEAGRMGVYYDAERRILVVPDSGVGTRQIPLELGHRVRVQARRIR